jgi:phosphonoacetaldehyde hydrolase
MYQIARITSRQGRELSKGVRGVIFDLAGTLIDTGCQAPVHAMTSAFAKNGLLVTDEIVRADMGLPKKAHIRAILEKPAILGQWECVYNNPPREVDVDRIYQSTNQKLKQVVGYYSKPTPCAVELLHYLQANGIRIGITTGYSREIIQAMGDRMHKHGIIYNTMVCADEVANPRPKAGMIFKILKDWSIPNYHPDMVIKIGDTIADIQEAHDAHIASCQVIDTCSGLGHITKTGGRNNRELLSSCRSETIRKFDDAGAEFYCNKLNDVLEVFQRK